MFRKRRKTTIVYIAVEIEHDEGYHFNELIRYLENRIVENVGIYSSSLTATRLVVGNSLYAILRHLSRFGWIDI